MPIHAIAPSPVARLLLELEARGATGGVDIGGRRIVLTKGAIVEVRPTAEDPSIGDFLVASGRLAEDDLNHAKRHANEQRMALETVLRARDLVPLEVLLETRRALWLERFVRGLSAEERIGKQPGLLTPEPHASPGPAIATLPFVLDGLARRAGFGDAEQVGREAHAWFDWLDTEPRARAEQWADFGRVEASVQVSTLFSRHPAAPSRIAALVRAGLARVSDERTPLPQPMPRSPVIAAPAPRASIIPQERGSIAPPKLMPSIRPLTPGQTVIEQGPLGIEPVAPWFPEATGALDDPLDAIERRIASLEQTDAAPAERSRAWLELSRAFRAHHDSLDEAARAAREAASADPRSEQALEAAALACSAMGEPELAYAYAAAWAELLDDPVLRARALVKASEYATRAEKDASSLRCMRLATDAVPDDPLLGERFARALATRGDVPGALRHARLAAERYRRLRPEAARAVLSWATQLAPDDAEVATDYASALASDGFGEAAVAVIARAARRSSDAPARIKLWLHAAVRAELAARPDLSADLLLEALDHEAPDAVQLHEPLANDLAAAGAALELSWICRELAARCQSSERSNWLLRSAEARLELPGDVQEAVETLTEALVSQPGNLRAYELLVQIAEAERDPRIVSDAVERALSSDRVPRPAGLLLLDLFIARLETHHKPPLDRWAWATSARLGGPGPSAFQQRAMEARLAHFENEIRALETELKTVAPEARAASAVRLAERMRDDPARRPKARKLLEKVLEIDPHASHARRQLTHLMRLLGERRTVCALEQQRVSLASAGFERVAAELGWIHAEIAADNPRGAIEACLSLLAHAPKNREALFILFRLARKAGDDVLVRQALLRRVDASLDPRERARALMAVSRALLAAGDPIEAVRRADAALAADPRCAEAAMMLVEYHGELEAVHRVAVLRAARTVLGDTPDLLAKLARASFGTRDAKGQLEALEAHLRLSPFDSFASLGLTVLWSTGAEPDAIALNVRRVLAPERMHPSATNAAKAGIERLWSLGHHALALELVVEAVNVCGELSDPLLSFALPVAEEAGEPRLTVSILERAVSRAQGDERAEALRRLARYQRQEGMRSAEARTFLRLLALAPRDDEALDRLAYIYAETREVERLTAVLTLRLELAEHDEERRERMLALALSAVHLAGDVETGKELVLSALQSEFDATASGMPDPALIQRGAGLLLSSAQPQAAFDLLLELSEGARRERRVPLLEEAVCIADQKLKNPDLALRAATLGLESYPEHTPFLLHFERLALDLHDVATGREVYRHLSASAIGLHGQRAVLYRAARWLEQAEARSDALSVAEQAFQLAPSDGAVLRSIERLSQHTGQYAAYVRCLKRLGDEAERPAQKSALYVRAARLSDDELRDPERAFGLYETAFATLPETATEDLAMACVRRWAEADPDAARFALARWREMLRELVKDAWATSERVRGLVSLARLSLHGFGEADEALRHVEDAEQNLAADDELPEPQRASLHAEVAAIAEELRPSRALTQEPGKPSELPPSSLPDVPPKATPTPPEAPISEPPSLGTGSLEAAPQPARGGSAEVEPVLVTPVRLSVSAAAERAREVPAHDMREEVDTPSDVTVVAALPEEIARLAFDPPATLPPAAGLEAEAPARKPEVPGVEPAPVAEAFTATAPQTAENDAGKAPSKALSAIPYHARPRAVETFARGRASATALTPVHRTTTQTDPGIAPPAQARDAERLSEVPAAAQEGLVELAEPVDDPNVPGLDPRDEADLQLTVLVRGDRDALVPLLSAFDGGQDRARSLADRLLTMVRRDGPSQASLEGLKALGKLSGFVGLESVASEVLSLFDPTISVMRRVDALHPDDPLVRAALLEARDDGDLAPVFTMLAHVYQGAGPLFRRSLTSYGVSASDFVSTRDDTALSRALRETTALFGVEHETYLKHSGEDRVGIIPTQPPAFLVGDKTHDEPLILRYRLARGFERARPGSVLLATLTRESAETLLSAIKAAFGPTDGKGPPVARDAAAMAAELWRTMPSSAQRQVGNLFRVLRDVPPLATLVHGLGVRAARVALIASSGIDVAAAALWTDTLPCENTPVRAAAGLDGALQEDAVFRALVLFAVGESYLALRNGPFARGAAQDNALRAP